MANTKIIVWASCGPQHRRREVVDAVLGVAESRQESVTMLEDQLADMVQFYLDEGIELPEAQAEVGSE